MPILGTFQISKACLAIFGYPLLIWFLNSSTYRHLSTMHFTDSQETRVTNSQLRVQLDSVETVPNHAVSVVLDARFRHLQYYWQKCEQSFVSPFSFIGIHIGREVFCPSTISGVQFVPLVYTFCALQSFRSDVAFCYSEHVQFRSGMVTYTVTGNFVFRSCIIHVTMQGTQRRESFTRGSSDSIDSLARPVDFS